MYQLKAGAIIIDPSFRYMLAVRGRISQKWGPPKGHLDEGETLLQGAVREIKEEIGVVLLFPENCDILPRLVVDRTRLFIVVLPFETAFSTEDPYEITEIGWLDMDNPPHSDLLTKIMKLCLKKRKTLTHLARANFLNYDLESETQVFNLNKDFEKCADKYLSLCHPTDVKRLML